MHAQELRRRQTKTVTISAKEDGNGGGFRVLVTKAGRYILDTMRVLRAALGILAFILILALLCCIFSAILIGFDLKSDSTTSVTVVEEPPPPGDGDPGPGEPDPTCSDGNPCTIDFLKDIGGCESIPLPEGTLCEDQCVRPEFANICKYVKLQKGVRKPICVGFCFGRCAVEEDCPVIMAEQHCSPLCDENDNSPPGPFITCYPRIPAIINVTCKSSICFYRQPELPLFVLPEFQEESDPFFLLTDIPDFECGNNEWFQAYCMGLIPDSEPFKKCLVPFVECLPGRGTFVPDPEGPEPGPGDDEDETPRFGDRLIIPPRCYYYFWCAKASIIQAPRLQ